MDQLKKVLHLNSRSMSGLALDLPVTAGIDDGQDVDVGVVDLLVFLVEDCSCILGAED